jgi:hypothetical protein
LSRIAGPAACALRLDGFVRRVGVEAWPKMADLRCNRPAATINSPVDRQAAANAGANGRVKHDTAAAAGAESRLGESRYVAIVA